MTGRVLGSLVLIGLFVYWFANHSGFFPYSHNPMQYMPNMHRTPSYKPQRATTLTSSGSSAMVPPAGAVARDANPYPYTHETLASDVPAKANPLPKSSSVVERGEYMYNTHCIVCHGAAGMGDGSVIGPFPKPPILVSDKLVNYADSQIFHIITKGQNTMMPYGHKIRVEDRWAIVHFVRVLQRAYNPKAEDIESFKNTIGAKEQQP